MKFDYSVAIRYLRLFPLRYATPHLVHRGYLSRIDVRFAQSDSLRWGKYARSFKFSAEVLQKFHLGRIKRRHLNERRRGTKRQFDFGFFYQIKLDLSREIDRSSGGAALIFWGD
jgi:hypothetical protein